MQETAGARTQLHRLTETGRGRQLLPRGETQRMGHPAIAAIHIVLDENEATRRFQQAAYNRHDRQLVLDEVQRIRHDHTIQRRQIERLREITLQATECGLRIMPLHRGR